MPSIGNRTLNLHTVKTDETIYSGPTHSVSHADTATLRRTLPTKRLPAMKTNIRFERGVESIVTEGAEESVVVSIAVTVPPGIDNVAAKAYVADSLTQASTLASEMALTGDIHL